jgi:hypothetical protein
MERQRPQWRASDAERQAVIAQIVRHAADGRLTLAEAEERVAEVWSARNLADLEQCLRELPPLAARNARLGATAVKASAVAKYWDWLLAASGYAFCHVYEGITSYPTGETVHGLPALIPGDRFPEYIAVVAAVPLVVRVARKTWRMVAQGHRRVDVIH